MQNGRKRVGGIKKKKGKGRPPGRVNLTLEQKEAIVSKVKAIALSLFQEGEIALVDVEYIKEGGGDILRIYIDKPSGVTLGDCSRISVELGDLLDVNLDIKTDYRLEVSSPGIQLP